MASSLVVVHNSTSISPFLHFPISPFTLFALLLCCLACRAGAPSNSTSDANADAPTRYEGSESPQVFSLIETGSLKLGRIAAVAEKVEAAEPFGEIVTLGVKNETGQELAFRVDCGTVLRATDARFQDLVVSRSLEGRVAPYAVWSGKLEVFALQLQRHYPYQPAEYHLGKIASGDLRNFVECFCFRRPEGSADHPFDLTPVQYAIWRIADNVTLQQVLSYARQQGNPSAEELTEAERKARGQGRFAEQLLEDCGIAVKFLD